MWAISERMKKKKIQIKKSEKKEEEEKKKQFYCRDLCIFITIAPDRTVRYNNNIM